MSNNSKTNSKPITNDNSTRLKSSKHMNLNCCGDKSRHSSSNSFIENIIKNYENTKKRLQKTVPSCNRAERKPPSLKYVERCMQAKSGDNVSISKLNQKGPRVSSSQSAANNFKLNTSKYLGDKNDFKAGGLAIFGEKSSCTSNASSYKSKYSTALTKTKSIHDPLTYSLMESKGIKPHNNSLMDTESFYSDFPSIKDGSLSWIETSISQKLFDDAEFIFHKEQQFVENNSKFIKQKERKEFSNKLLTSGTSKLTTPTRRKCVTMTKVEKEKRETVQFVAKTLLPELFGEILNETIEVFQRSIFHSEDVRLLALNNAFRNSEKLSELIQAAINFITKIHVAESYLNNQLNKKEIIDYFGSFLKWINAKDETISSQVILDLLNESCLLSILRMTQNKPIRRHYKTNMEYNRGIVLAIFRMANRMETKHFLTFTNDLFLNNEFFIRLSIISDKYLQNYCPNSLQYKETILDLEYLKHSANLLDKVVINYFINKTRSQALTTDWLTVVMGKTIITELKGVGDLRNFDLNTLI